MMKTVLISVILMLLLSAATGWGAKKTLTIYTWDKDIDVVPSETYTTSLPDANIPVLAVSGSNIMSALNTAGLTDYVGGETYWDSKCGWSPWTVIENLPLIDDPQKAACKIRSMVIPLKTSSVSALRQTWQNYGMVNYDVQVKMSWFYGLTYAASGVNFRWKESSETDKYEGYGVSFLYFKSQTSCSSASTDYIPSFIKPESADQLKDTLLVVLWRQKVVEKTETRNWLAYAVMNDSKIKGGQSTYESPSMTDNATLAVRVEDIKSNIRRFSDIKIYYGEATTSSSTRGFDAVATNIYRGAYLPKCKSGSPFPTWPSNTLENYEFTAYYWSYSRWYGGIPYLVGNIVTPVNRLASDNLAHSYRCATAGITASSQPIWPVTSGAAVGDGTVTWRENGTSRPTSYDYFTLLSFNPKVISAAPNTDVQWVINPELVNDVMTNKNPGATVSLQADRATFRTSDFSLADYPATRPEIALHGMGNLTGGTYWFFDYINRGTAFTDLAVQILGKRE